MQTDGKIYYDIFKAIRTTQEQVIFLDRIDAFSRQLYQNKPITAQTVHELFGEKTGASILAGIQGNKIEFSDLSQMKFFFNALGEYAKSAEVIHATLAVTADEEILQILSQWMERTFIGQPVVIELIQNIGVVGGIKLDYKGHYWDYSLQSQVVKVFKEKKDELFEPHKKQ